MKRLLKYWIFLPPLIEVFLFTGCKEPFNPPAIVDTRHFLVVEGFINSGAGPTNFTLTRTRNLSDTGAIHNISGVPDSIFVTGALVYVEDEEENSFPLFETDKGHYKSPQLYLNNQKRYRLHIKTAKGKQYVSDYVPVIRTPPIAEVHWYTLPNDGLHIEVSANATGKDTKYYRWTYSETWEFYTKYLSKYRYDPNDLMLKKRKQNELLNHCWQSDKSRKILLATSDRLRENKIKRIPLTVVPYHNEKASVRYSILVNQMEISKEEYEFWLNMKKNTESLGSIFDPQPSNSTGNIRSLSDLQEPVIGYVGVEEVKSKRIFIENRQLPPDWNPLWSKCELIKVNPDSVFFYYGLPVYFPVDKNYGTYRYCADCTTRGTTKKPSFWP